MDMRLWTRIKLMEESQHFVLKHYVREYVKKAYIGHAEIVMNSLINEEILIGLKENDKKMQEHDLNYEEGEL